MEIFVTGATGVLGGWAVQHLVESGHRVRGLVHTESKSTLLQALGAEPVRGDIFDPTSVAAAVAGCQAILHLATHIPPTTAMGKKGAWDENDRIRTVGTRNIVDAALAHNVQTVLYPSICFIYPASGDTWIEATNCAPIEAPFNQSSLAAEREIQRFTDGGGRGIVLRLGFLYGPESPQSHEQLKYARIGIATVPGQPTAYHPFLWIPDAGRAVVAGLEHAPAGTYDVVDDNGATTQETAQAMAQAVRKQRLWVVPQFLMRLMMGAEIVDSMGRSQRVSNERFKAATGWQPQLPSQAAGWQQIANGSPAVTAPRQTSVRS